MKKILTRVSILAGLLFIILFLVYEIAEKPNLIKNNSTDHQGPSLTSNQISSAITIKNNRSKSFNPADKKAIQHLLKSDELLNLRRKEFDITANGQVLNIETSIDLSLQNFILDKIDRVNAEDVGIVAMDPSIGRILAMASYNRKDPGRNQCTNALFPSASVFKILTAAAGIETYDLHLGSNFSYTGGKHTLYKSQIAHRNGIKKNQISFEDSFAQSVNPVFGEMGISLGRNILSRYAETFGFNHTIDFEIPVPPSIVSISEDPYQLAEVASGYNRHTSISPVHGAVIAGIILNRGVWVEPTIINRIYDPSGILIYRSKVVHREQVITPETASMLQDLMVATVESGTCKRTFANHQEDMVLSQLVIGGKTGSINNQAQDKHYNWFIGFAKKIDGPECLVLSIVVAHGKRIVTKANLYARMAIEHYFRDKVAGNRHLQIPEQQQNES